MRIKIITLAFLTCLALPSLGNAASPAITDDEAKLKVFSDACVAKWVEDGGANKANPDFKLFGQRFCDCAGKQMLPILNKENVTVSEMEAAKKQASEACLTEASLQQALSSDNRQNTSPQKLEASCSKTWQLLFPNGITDTQKQFITYFCHCSAGPLAQSSSKGATISDVQSNAKISEIAAACRK